MSISITVRLMHADSDFDPVKMKVKMKFLKQQQPTFLYLWRRVHNWIIYCEDDTEPITDLDISLEHLADKRLRARLATQDDLPLLERMDGECEEKLYEILNKQIEALTRLREQKEQLRAGIFARGFFSKIDLT